MTPYNHHPPYFIRYTVHAVLYLPVFKNARYLLNTAKLIVSFSAALILNNEFLGS